MNRPRYVPRSLRQREGFVVVKNVVRALVVLGLTASVVVLARPASADTQPGILGIYGPGKVYAGTDSVGGNEQAAIVSELVQPGKKGTFHVEVRNTSNQTRQFLLRLEADASNGVHLFAGKTDVTDVASILDTPDSGYV